MNVQIPTPATTDLATDQGPPACRVGFRRLRQCRHHLADRRRDALRGRRSPQQSARPRCGCRQRQCDARRGPPLADVVSTIMSVLCSSAAANVPKLIGLPVTFRRPTLKISVRRTEASTSCFPPSALCSRRTRRGRERALQLPPGREDRPRQLDAGGLHRPGCSRQSANLLPPAPGVKSPALWGTKARLRHPVRCEGDRRRAEQIFCLPLQVTQALGRALPRLLRAGPQGICRDRSTSARGARGRPLRFARRNQRREGRFACCAKRVSRGGHYQESLISEECPARRTFRRSAFRNSIVGGFAIPNLLEGDPG